MILMLQSIICFVLEETIQLPPSSPIQQEYLNPPFHVLPIVWHNPWQKQQPNVKKGMDKHNSKILTTDN